MYTTLSMNRDLKCSNGSVATRKLQFVVHNCGERKEDEWAKVVLLMNDDFGMT